MNICKTVAAVAMIAATASLSAQNDYVQITDLPAVYIETENSQEIVDKENYVRATLRYVDKSGVTTYDALGVRGRGNSTWALPKKPYRIKFDKKQTFLGKDRANAKSWTMLANATDKTLIRNALASYIASVAGQPFVPAAQFVDLVLNGKFLGNYQISDQMEIRKKRVDITEQDEPATAGSNITGGYLLEVDGFAASEPVYFVTKLGISITVKSPDEDIINKDQLNYISSHVQAFEDALYSEDFTDPVKGYRPYVDSETLISWYVASELTANPDSFWSTYIYKEKDDDKIYWGPMWDYDIAFNNCRRKGNFNHRMIVEGGYGLEDLTGLWVTRMWKDPWFVNLVNDKWQELKAMDIENVLLKFIDSQAAQIDESQKKNFEIWPIDELVYDEYRLFDTYKGGLDYLKESVSRRVATIDAYIAQQMSAVQDVIADKSVRLSYDRGALTLRVANARPDAMVEVYAVSGTPVLRAPVGDGVSLSLLAPGVYVARCGDAVLKLVK